MSRQILITNDPSELDFRATQLFTAISTDSISTRGVFNVALSGGRTPRSLFQLLASEDHRNKIDWNSVRFYFGDERNVGVDSPESNFRMANESLFKPLAINPQNIHRWRTELGPEAAAADYRSAIASLDRFDLVLLGLGDDGHTASLFPGSPALDEHELTAVANWVEKFGDYRLTITFRVINGARNILFLVSGSEKAEAVATVLENPSDETSLPAQLVEPTEGSLFWILDGSASQRLQDVADQTAS